MQKQVAKTVRLMRIKPSIVGNTLSLESEIVSKEVDFSQDDISMLDFYYEHTECNCIDIVTFGDVDSLKSFTVVVDDEGLLKSGNVVMTYQLDILGVPYELDLCGAILIGKSDYIEGREDGLYEVGLDDEQIQFIQNNLAVKFLGVTR